MQERNRPLPIILEPILNRDFGHNLYKQQAIAVTAVRAPVFVYGDTEEEEHRETIEDGDEQEEAPSPRRPLRPWARGGQKDCAYEKKRRESQSQYPRDEPLKVDVDAHWDEIVVLKAE